MAFDDNYDPADDPMSYGAPHEEQPVTWGDRGKSLAHGVLEQGAIAAAGVRASGDASDSPNMAAIADYIRSSLHTRAARTQESMGEDARSLLHSTVTSPEFWEHPLNAATLRVLNMTPSVAVAVIPAMLTSSPLAGAAAGGALGAAMSADDTYSQTDAMSDEELQAAMPYYRGLRSMNVPEKKARAEANTKLMGLKPVYNAVAGAVGMTLGPAGRLSGVIPEAGGGLLKRVGVGAAEGALGGSLMMGTGEATHQQTEIELDKRTELDPSLILAAGAQGALEMGALGAVGGAFTGGHAEPARRGSVEILDAHNPDAAQMAAMVPDAVPEPSLPNPVTPRVTETPPVAAASDSLPVQTPVPESVQAKLRDDAGQTVPEAPATLAAQMEQLAGGQRRAVLFPKGGEPVPPVPEGYKKVVTRDGAFIYDPAQLKPKTIYDASKAGRLNEILDLGDFSKADLIPKLQAGEQPLAVTERTPAGVEVKAAAGTESTAASQLAALETSKTPGNVVKVEMPGAVIAARERAAAVKARQQAAPEQEPVHAPSPELNKLSPEIIAKVAHETERLTMEAERYGPVSSDFIERTRTRLMEQAQKEAGFVAPEPAAARARPVDKGVGKNRTEGEKLARAQTNQAADAILSHFTATEAETANLGHSVGRDLLADRLRGAIEKAKEMGLKLPGKIKDNIDESMNYGHGATWLVEAKTLLDKFERGKATKEDIQRFLSREAQLRSGEKADQRAVIAERRAEGEAKMQQRLTRAEDLAEPKVEKVEEATSESDVAPEHVSESVEVDTTPRQEPVAREREAVTLKGNEVVAGKDKTGTFKTEVKKTRKPVRRMGSAAIKPRDEFAYHTYDGVEPIESGTFRDYIKNTVPSRKGINDILAPHIAKRMRDAIGDTPVHIISDAAMERMAPADQHGFTTGFYTRDMANKPVIYIHEEMLGDAGRLRHTLMHEGVHVALQRAIDSNPAMRDVIHKMMIDTADFIGEKIGPESDLYGLTDAHEFISEAMSNPDFMEILSLAPASKSLVNKLQLDRPMTLKGMLIQLVRKILGIGDKPNDIRVLEAALEISDRLMSIEKGLQNERTFGKRNASKDRVGNFEQSEKHIREMFHEPFTASLGRGKDGAARFVESLTSPAKGIASAIESGRAGVSVLSKAIRAVTTTDQYVQHVQHLLPMARDISDNIERAGVQANKLKEDGLELTGAMLRAQKQNPGLFEKFASLVNRQTMVGADASVPIGVGRNAHLTLSKDIQAKLDKGLPLDDLAHDAAMKSWEARHAHARLAEEYAMIVRQNPEYASLQKQLFDFYEQSQKAMVRDQIDNILRTFDFKGTEAERAAAAESLYSGKISDEVRAKLEEKVSPEAIKLIEATHALKVVNGPYAPQMRRGEHAVIGEYKVEAPKNAAKIDDNTFEFKTRKEAHDFAVNTGLHVENKSVWYDTATGKQVKSKDDAISQNGQPEQRFQVTVQRQHLEFHESAKDARARIAELKESGLLEKVGLEERRHIESEESQFTTRGVDGLLRSLAAQKAYQAASEYERGVMRHTIREAGLRSLSDNRVQSRRLPRRYVQGASDDVARNLYDYNNSQANYRARMQYREAIDQGLRDMWDHVKKERYTPANEQRSSAANEMERRARAQDPNDYTGAYTEWTRRLSTWSYIDRMMRPSHLILHQTHLPMITAPYMAGRHGILSAYGQTMKAWKELTNFYGAGGHDAWATTVGSALQKGTDYTELAKKALTNTREKEMLDVLGEIGVIHPSAGIEVGKYLPSHQVGGPLGALDRGMSKVDTIFRHLTNATEAINRIAGALAAYRMEYAKLTREGKSSAQAHQAGIEYARVTLTDTQGLYSATNAAPIFKNKFLKPFLQFKQFPQMMYHLLTKLVIQSYKGETRAAKVQAMSSLAAILGMHSMMAGALQGLPLEPFKILAMISKGIGLTDTDWTDVEHAERRSIKAVLGEDVGNMVIHGAGSELFGVDVHHRLGLNSFVTFGMPDQMDSKSVSEFMTNAVLGAPGALVTDALKGTHKMMQGDLQNGALQAFPLQAFRDIRNAVDPKPNKYGYEPTEGDRVKSALGFSPAKKVHLAEQKDAVFGAVRDYNEKRYGLTKAWVDATPEDRVAAWEAIQEFNAEHHGEERITKGDLFKALHRANSAKIHSNRSVVGVKVNAHNKSIAEGTVDLYH